MKTSLFIILFFFIGSCQQEKKELLEPKTFTFEEIQHLRKVYFENRSLINVYFITNPKDKIHKTVEKVVEKMRLDSSFRSDDVIHLSHNKINYSNFGSITPLFELPEKSYIYFLIGFDSHEKQVKVFERLKNLGHRPFLVSTKNRSEEELITYLIDVHLNNRLVPLSRPK